MSASTWIVIVNYRTADLVVDCLRSLSTQVGDLGGGRVIVADNASGDASTERLAAEIAAGGWSAWAEVHAQPRNGGFAYGNNAGIRAAMAATHAPDYVLLLNPDTVARPGAVRALVDFMEAHPDVGIAGSLLENAAGGVDCSAHRIPSPLGELNGAARLGLLSRLLHRHAVSPPRRDEAHECDWVSGASMIVRRQVLEQIGPMDEGYFLYFEEVDFCCRARAAGWSVWYVPESRVLHLEGASTGIRVAAKRRAAYWYDSRRRFFVTHHGVGGLLLADLLWAAGRLSFLLRAALGLTKPGGHADPKRFMFDLLWGDLRALLSGRARAGGARP
ncbi:MAG: glycosyl transferase family 2 [Rhodocyclaceae bacterium]|nr:MAG: glycosyl transferase family 2 [Rhodocyclaceae bacterium]TNC98417.1 MAG: glycosyl transferase family 2 [Rhodocyclaceae bacterium]